MGASATLSDAALTVEPGQEQRVTVRVRNTGSIVDELMVDVLGDAAGWATVEPPVVRCFPGGEETAQVVFRPPRVATSRPGPTPFAVRVFSREDPEGSTVQEGVIEVAPYDDLGAELVPRTMRGRRKATFELAVDNRGNQVSNAQVSARDPDGLLEFDLRPDTIVAEPGTATFGKIVARPKKSFWRGPPKTLPFQVTVAEPGQPPVYCDGAMLQEARLPKWLLPALAVLAALALALLILWLTVLKPTVESAAREAVAAQVDEATEAAAAADEAATAAQDAAGGAQAGADAAQGAADEAAGAGSEGGGGLAGLLDGRPIDLRITASPGVAPGATATFTSTAQPADRSVMVTDVFFQNPRGDSGVIELRRGTQVLLQLGLNNFRDLDYHFVVPVEFAAGSPITVAVECANVGPACTPAVSLSGVVPEPDTA